MLAMLARNAKVIALVAGFAFATLGTLWSWLVIGNLNAQVEQLTKTKAEIAAQIELLNRIASEYFIANQQGDLIFILAQQGSANQEVAKLIYQGNVLDRATPVRNMIGALALMNQLDYRQTYDTYEKLNDETRANMTFDHFMQLKQRESEIIMQGQERVPVLLNQSAELDKSIRAKQAEQSRNQLIGVIAAMVGSALLLGANLLAEKGNVSRADKSNPSGPSTQSAPVELRD